MKRRAFPNIARGTASVNSVIVRDSQKDTGYQLLGEMARVSDVAVMDGYTLGMKVEPLPQEERELVIKVEKITDFKRAPHSDIEE